MGRLRIIELNLLLPEDAPAPFLLLSRYVIYLWVQGLHQIGQRHGAAEKEEEN